MAVAELRSEYALFCRLTDLWHFLVTVAHLFHRGCNMSDFPLHEPACKSGRDADENFPALFGMMSFEAICVFVKMNAVFA
jgi:hypothetical protein